MAAIDPGLRVCEEIRVEVVISEYCFVIPAKAGTHRAAAPEFPKPW